MLRICLVDIVISCDFIFFCVAGYLHVSFLLFNFICAPFIHFLYTDHVCLAHIVLDKMQYSPYANASHNTNIIPNCYLR